jgi:hypothetical protein
VGVGYSLSLTDRSEIEIWKKFWRIWEVRIANRYSDDNTSVTDSEVEEEEELA